VNPLATNPRARHALYVVLWGVGLVLGAVQVGYGATDADAPALLHVALAVYAFLGAAVGYTAQANVSFPVEAGYE
jgi:hypothetical protein